MMAVVRRCALKTAGPIYAESTSCGDLREIAAMPRNDDACAPPHVATRRTNLRRIAFYVGFRENAATPCKYPRQPLTSTPHPAATPHRSLRFIAHRCARHTATASRRVLHSSVPGNNARQATASLR
ncbi:hypothetical protein [Paraburkholderia graminis]|uniref:hypothetical protein n=1 Tax=Paraburkholderia graminis TaxID=60548 RepID=UPI0038B9B6A1